MATKYYEAQNCNRLIQSGGMRFDFKPYRLFAGSWDGVFTTDNEDAQKAMDYLIANPRSAIKEITAAEHQAKLESSPDYVANYNPTPESEGKTVPAPVASKTAGRIIPSNAVVQDAPGPENQPEIIPSSAPVDDADALKVGSVPATPAAKPVKV